GGGLQHGVQDRAGAPSRDRYEMMVGEGGGGGREDGVSPTRRSVPSTRVQLEVAFLDADETGPAPAGPVVLDERRRLTVLVVAAEADVRRYVRECLRERVDLR